MTGLSADAIASHCACRALYSISVHPCLSSTNTVVRALAKEGAPTGTVVFAEQQTGGRGRLGRSFFSPPGSGIYMTLLLRPSASLQSATAVTTFAAVAVARAVERVASLDARIKWVNDIWIGQKKVCGILAEGTVSPDGKGFSDIALGIGINVTETAFPEELSHIATSLERECGQKIDRNLLSAYLLEELSPLFKDRLPTDVQEEYRRRNLVIGKRLTVLVGDRSFFATAIRIEDDGNLIVRLDDGSEERLSAGEVSLRL